MIRLSIITYIMGIVLSLVMFTSVTAQTTTPAMEPVEPTSPPSTGYGVK